MVSYRLVDRIARAQPVIFNSRIVEALCFLARRHDSLPLDGRVRNCGDRLRGEFHQRLYRVTIEVAIPRKIGHAPLDRAFVVAVFGSVGAILLMPERAVILLPSTR